MKPLNIITHIKSNIKRISKTILTLALEFAALTFLISIGVSIINATNYNLNYGIDNVIEVNLPENDLTDYKNKISKIANVKLVTEGYFENAIGMLPLMYTSTSFFCMEAEDIPKFLENTDMHIIEGRLPKNKNEIVLTKEGLNLCKANLNDMIGTDYNNIMQLNSNYKIVGIIEGSTSCYFSVIDKQKSKNKLLIQTSYEHKNQIKDDLIALNITDISDLLGAKDFIANVTSVLTRLGLLVVGIFSIVILITVINLSKSLISNFYEEYSLLYALGYNLKVITKRVRMQLLFIILTSSIIGVLLGIVINILFNNLYCIPRGIYYSSISIFMLLPLAVSFVLFFLSLFSTRREVKNKLLIFD